MTESSRILPLRLLLHQPWHICMTTARHRLTQSGGYGLAALSSQQGLTTTHPFLPAAGTQGCALRGRHGGMSFQSADLPLRVCTPLRHAPSHALTAKHGHQLQQLARWAPDLKVPVLLHPTLCLDFFAPDLTVP